MAHARHEIALGAAQPVEFFVLLALALLPLEKAIAGCLLAAIATFWLAARFKRWLGGYTGDCLGATQQVSEIAFYLGLLASLAQ